MTPQPEFIISLRLLLRIEKLLGYEIEQIRSRPAPSPPPETCVFGYSPELCHEKDTAIRNATLDEVISMQTESEGKEVVMLDDIKSLRTQEHP